MTIGKENSTLMEATKAFGALTDSRHPITSGTCKEQFFYDPLSESQIQPRIPIFAFFWLREVDQQPSGPGRNRGTLRSVSWERFAQSRDIGQLGLFHWTLSGINCA